MTERCPKCGGTIFGHGERGLRIAVANHERECPAPEPRKEKSR